MSEQQDIRTAPFDEATPAGRLEALRRRLALFEGGQLEMPPKTSYVNNHIHTSYSFSPYSPTGAAYTAWLNGLPTAGIMDHDSIAGAEEFIAAGRMLGIATTCGVECRCKMDATPFAGRRINNPDQDSVVYVAFHGIPHQSFGAMAKWLVPYREARNRRNAAMVGRINQLLAGSNVRLDFEKDAIPLSQWANGGSVTERHILYALAFKVTAAVGRGQPVLDFLAGQLQLTVTGKSREALLDAARPDYEYVLLGVFKASLVERFYIPATDECPHITEYLRFAKEIGAVSAYAYLGDVGDSVTGDKKAQKFEDDYLDALVPWLAESGFAALTYMPTRNTSAQLSRLTKLCDENGLFQISGEDINSPSQSFICKALDDAQYKHLVTSTWALIGHEAAATENIDDGMFSPKTLAVMPGLNARIAHFAEIGHRQATGVIDTH